MHRVQNSELSPGIESSKLLKQPASVLRGLSKQLWELRKSLTSHDEATVLPKAKSEPVYMKSDWERELETALRESRAMVT